jgi:ketosteroid isomerase-like protein
MQALALALTALLLTQQPPGAAVSREWFEKTEQALMDAVAAGDRATWDRVMDDSCVMTGEEGERLAKAEFLKGIRPLPQGLVGDIRVRELTVQDVDGVAVVRFLADETETVFGQHLATKYRTTDVFKRSADAWKLVASHTSVVTADPPAQQVPTDGWSRLAGTYRLLPDGWTFHVVLRDGQLFGGRDPNALRPLIPMSPTAFVLKGSLGEWLFVTDSQGKGTRIVNLRKFEPLVWTRVDE